MSVSCPGPSNSNAPWPELKSVISASRRGRGSFPPSSAGRPRLGGTHGCVPNAAARLHPSSSSPRSTRPGGAVAPQPARRAAGSPPQAPRLCRARREAQREARPSGSTTSTDFSARFQGGCIFPSKPSKIFLIPITVANERFLHAHILPMAKSQSQTVEHSSDGGQSP